LGISIFHLQCGDKDQAHDKKRDQHISSGANWKLQNNLPVDLLLGNPHDMIVLQSIRHIVDRLSDCLVRGKCLRIRVRVYYYTLYSHTHTTHLAMHVADIMRCALRCIVRVAITYTLLRI